jgi:ABC-type glycerol-3-phosphate transport system permease component
MMANLLNLAMLACAAVGSMVFGILAAYAILRMGFALMRPQPAVRIETNRPEPAGML